MNLKKWKGIFTSKFVGNGPSSYEKRIYRVAVSQRLRNTDLNNTQFNCCLTANTLHPFRRTNWLMDAQKKDP